MGKRVHGRGETAKCVHYFSFIVVACYTLFVALLDHFQPPLSLRRRWRGFHHAWATTIASEMNARLPDFHVAMANIQYGVEIDAACSKRPELVWAEPPHATGSVQRATVEKAISWSPPVPIESVPLAVLNDIVEVQVFNEVAGLTPVAAIELIVPSSKDSSAHRDAFVLKCKSLVQVGLGLMVVDVVTEPHANLHADFQKVLGGTSQVQSTLFAASYHPVEQGANRRLDVWHKPIRIGDGLPTLPLWLKGGLCLEIDLQKTYDQTCRSLRINEELK